MDLIIISLLTSLLSRFYLAIKCLKNPPQFLITSWNEFLIFQEIVKKCVLTTTIDDCWDWQTIGKLCLMLWWFDNLLVSNSWLCLLYQKKILILQPCQKTSRHCKPCQNSSRYCKLWQMNSRFCKVLQKNSRFCKQWMHLGSFKLSWIFFRFWNFVKWILHFAIHVKWNSGFKTFWHKFLISKAFWKKLMFWPLWQMNFAFANYIQQFPGLVSYSYY